MEKVSECVDRCRRVETRVTKFLEEQGFDTGVQRPVWGSTGYVDLPSPAVSMKDILATVPADWDRDEPVRVLHKGDTLGELYVGAADDRDAN
jgi:hypothetical protein